MHPADEAGCFKWTARFDVLNNKQMTDNKRLSVTFIGL